jgi:F-type H+-transporting ATPase subunit epsilon
MQVSILESKGAIWEGQAKQVILPAEEGDVSILDFHQPFLMKLKTGVISAEPRAANNKQRFAIKHGLAFMKSDTLKVFVET